MKQPLPTEYERKYEVGSISEITQRFDHLPEHRIEQYYLNYINEPFELRMRRISDGDSNSYSATIKTPNPPDRLEIETTIDRNTWESYRNQSKGRIHKLRRTLPLAVGCWALDHYPDKALTILEAEGEQTEQPVWGHEVTHDTTYTNSMLARETHDLEPQFTKDRLAKQRLFANTADLVNNHRTVVIGVAGATGSGKTTLASGLAQEFNATMISMDDYYKGKTRLTSEGVGEPNWDHPSAFDIDKLVEDLHDFRADKAIKVPRYSMATSDPTGEFEQISSIDSAILVIEGLFTLVPKIKSQLNLAVYVDAPLATRLGRRVVRDVAEGRAFAPADNLRYCLEVAEPTFQEQAYFQQSLADHIINT